MDSRQETALDNERLHWGIFIPAFVLLFVLAVPILPLLFFVKIMTDMMSQLIPKPTHSLSWLVLCVLIPDLLIFGLLLLATWIAYLKSEIKLTNKRLIFHAGLLSRVSGELPLENVESIFIIEPFIGRLCGYGTVTVTSVGGRSFRLRYIGFPQAFHARLQNAVANAKTTQRAKSPESNQPPHGDDSRFMSKI